MSDVLMAEPQVETAKGERRRSRLWCEFRDQYGSIRGVYGTGLTHEEALDDATLKAGPNAKLIAAIAARR